MTKQEWDNLRIGDILIANPEQLSNFIGYGQIQYIRDNITPSLITKIFTPLVEFSIILHDVQFSYGPNLISPNGKSRELEYSTESNTTLWIPFQYGKKYSRFDRIGENI